MEEASINTPVGILLDRDGVGRVQGRGCRREQGYGHGGRQWVMGNGGAPFGQSLAGTRESSLHETLRNEAQNSGCNETTRVDAP